MLVNTGLRAHNIKPSSCSKPVKPVKFTLVWVKLFSSWRCWNNSVQMESLAFTGRNYRMIIFLSKFQLCFVLSVWFKSQLSMHTVIFSALSVCLCVFVCMCVIARERGGGGRLRWFSSQCRSLAYINSAERRESHLQAHEYLKHSNTIIDHWLLVVLCVLFQHQECWCLILTCCDVCYTICLFWYCIIIYIMTENMYIYKTNLSCHN